CPGHGVELHSVATIALDSSLDPEIEVGPYGLRPGVAAPHAAVQRVGEEQNQRREDQEAGEIIHLLRPDLDEEEVEARVRYIDQDRLVRQARSPVPPYERNNVVDAERDPQHDPF